MTSLAHRRRATLAAGTGLVLATLVGPASASPVRAAPADGGCTTPYAARTTGRSADGPSYTPRQLRRIDADLRDALAARRSAAARTGAELRIGVHVHVVRSDSDRGPTRTRVRRQLAVMNDAYAAGQSASGAATRFSFRLASFERVRNNRWHQAMMGSRADLEMRRALHRGGPADLNLYILRPRARGSDVVLGWSTSPWDAARRLRLDGVSINEGSLPGGSLRPYDRGDTAVHEAGHWLGLLHTFEGGCTEPNDLVADTPQEQQPSSTCILDKDTCPADGLDPVHNFMDYAVDSCMTMFTPGQVARMTDNWLAYRTP